MTIKTLGLIICAIVALLYIISFFIPKKKKPEEPAEVISSNGNTQIIEKIREVPVEKIIEKEVMVPDPKIIAQLEAEKKHSGELANRISDLSNQLSKIHSTTGEATSKIVSLEKTIAEKDIEIKNLANENHSLSKVLEEKTQNIQELTNNVQNTNTDSQNKIDKLTSEIAELKKSHATELENKDTQIAQLNEALESQRIAASKSTDEQVALIEAKLNVADKNYKAAEERINELTQQYGASQDEITILKERNNSLETANNDLSEENLSLKAELDEATSNIEAISNNSTALNNDNEDLSNRLATALEDNGNLNETLEKANKLLSDMQTRIDDLAAALDEKEAHIDLLNSEVESLKEQAVFFSTMEQTRVDLAPEEVEYFGKECETTESEDIVDEFISDLEEDELSDEEDSNLLNIFGDNKLEDENPVITLNETNEEPLSEDKSIVEEAVTEEIKKPQKKTSKNIFPFAKKKTSTEETEEIEIIDESADEISMIENDDTSFESSGFMGSFLKEEASQSVLNLSTTQEDNITNTIMSQLDPSKMSANELEKMIRDMIVKEHNTFIEQKVTNDGFFDEFGPIYQVENDIPQIDEQDELKKKNVYGTSLYNNDKFFEDILDGSLEDLMVVNVYVANYSQVEKRHGKATADNMCRIVIEEMRKVFGANNPYMMKSTDFAAFDFSDDPMVLANKLSAFKQAIYAINTSNSYIFVIEVNIGESYGADHKNAQKAYREASARCHRIETFADFEDIDFEDVFDDEEPLMEEKNGSDLKEATKSYLTHAYIDDYDDDFEFDNANAPKKNTKEIKTTTIDLSSEEPEYICEKKITEFPKVVINADITDKATFKNTSVHLEVYLLDKSDIKQEVLVTGNVGEDEILLVSQYNNAQTTLEISAKFGLLLRISSTIKAFILKEKKEQYEFFQQVDKFITDNSPLTVAGMYVCPISNNDNSAVFVLLENEEHKLVKSDENGILEFRGQKYICENTGDEFKVGVI